MNEDFTPEAILTGLYKLACVGSARALNIDLIKLEELSGMKTELSTVITLANLGASSEDELEFVRVCEEALQTQTGTTGKNGG